MAAIQKVYKQTQFKREMSRILGISRNTVRKLLDMEFTSPVPENPSKDGAEPSCAEVSMEYGDDEWVQNIQLHSGRLSKLITNLITLSRLDEERTALEKSEFSLSDAL